MTAKDWSLINNRYNGNDMDFLYQVYLTKYRTLDRNNFEKLLQVWMRMYNFDTRTLKNNIKQKYDREFGAQGG